MHAWTQKWVKEHLLGFNIYTEWIDEAASIKWFKEEEARRKKRGAKPSKDDPKPPEPKTREQRIAMQSEVRGRAGEELA